ncbi:MAG: gamma carbonic anhydrase family protein [bacterium]
MAIYEISGKRPRIGAGTFVHEAANVVGDVEIGKDCYVGSGAAIRGDFGAIRVGSGSSVQENCVMHANPGIPCRVGDGCTIGHGAVLHGCTIENGALVGMNAVVSDGAVVGEGSVVAEGAVVPARHVVAPGRIAAGVPAKEIGAVSDGHRELMKIGSAMYMKLTADYISNCRRIG